MLAYIVFGKMPECSRSFLVMIWLLASLCFSLESALKDCGEPYTKEVFWRYLIP